MATCCPVINTEKRNLELITTTAQYLGGRKFLLFSSWEVDCMVEAAQPLANDGAEYADIDVLHL